MYEKKNIKPWIDLAEAVITFAERDAENPKGIKDKEKWKSDARLFLESQWCNYLQYTIDLFYHKNNYARQVSSTTKIF